jgi:hypothetical protein
MVAAFTPKQVRDSTVAAVMGAVEPAQDVQSDDAKFNVAETARLQAEAQQRIDKTRPANQIGASRDDAPQ